MSSLRSRVDTEFRARVGAPPELMIRAPGRVNLVGEHAAALDGYALPCAIDLGTVVASRRREDRLVRVWAPDLDGAVAEFHADMPYAASDGHPWVNPVRGAFGALADKDLDLGGAELVIAGDVPRGVGLSASASLAVAVVKTIVHLNGVYAISPNAVALAAQRVRGVLASPRSTGSAETLASVRGGALLVDCRSLQVRPVGMPDDLAILIVNSGVRPGAVTGEYSRRRLECEVAARHFGVSGLRDIDMPTLLERAAGLDDTLLRRARHVVSENERVIAVAEALDTGDLRRLGQLMTQSHASMRNDFEITVPKIDYLVDVLNIAIAGEGGARMTGGGFGGCVVALLPKSRVAVAKAAVFAHYRTPDNERAACYVCEAGEGAAVMTPERMED